jgi:hypothetical protein
VVGRYGPTTPPEKIDADIETALEESGEAAA